MDQVLSKARSSRTYTPTEHDVVGYNVKQYRERHGKNALGRGWQSFGSVIQLECQSDAWFFCGRLRRPEADRPKVARGMRGDRRLARSCVGQRRYTIVNPSVAPEAGVRQHGNSTWLNLE
jgi:hypothetical protein